MQVKSNPMTVGDYVDAVSAKRIKINRDYQRSGGLWPYRAKCALIETIILGYPMPALFLNQQFDLDTRKPFRDIVDGQQRTDAIISFFEGELKLSAKLGSPRLRGRSLSKLEQEDYEAFITYSLPIFLFIDATAPDVQEAFRRINSHTSVLNPEEKRHSLFQGTMKWFVVDLSKKIQETLRTLNVYTKTQLLRMQDARLVSEILFVIYNGIKTTKAEHLDSLFSAHDDEDSMDDADDISNRILAAIDVLSTWEWLPNTHFTKSYHFFCLLLAVMHAQRPVTKLTDLGKGGSGLLSDEEITLRMAMLQRALESADDLVALQSAESEPGGRLGDHDGARNSDEEGPQDFADVDRRLLKYVDFVRASGTMTNTDETRKVRFRTFLGSAKE